jgi:hypothetical protein
MAVLSHFGNQGSAEDELSIQNLLLNFLIDANTAREERTPKRKEKVAKEAPQGEEAKKGGN